MEEIKYKKCSKCGEEKELNAENFFRRKDSKDGYRGQCRDCINQYKKQYNKKYYAENLEYYKNYNIEHSKQRKEYYSQYYQDNSDKIKARVKKWEEDNQKEYKEYQSQYGKIYRQTSHGKAKIKIKGSNRRARINSLPNTLTPEEYESTLEYFNHCCAYCNCKLDEDNHHMEHIVPVSKGGGTTQRNIIPSCESCNLSKHVKTLADWYRFSDDFSIEKLAQIAKHLAQFTDWVVSGDE